MAAADSSTKLCSEAGCKRPHRARGLCSTHYNRDRYTAAERQAIREQSQRRQATCPTCLGTFAAQRSTHMYCSLVCRSGGAFLHQYTEADRIKSREHSRRRRAARRSGEVEKFSDSEIYERDGWRCGICRRAVNKNLRWPHPRSATIDHIIPLGEAGSSHTKRNVRCAHLSCNSARGTRGGGEQLALLG
jgi:hypothetical protein